MKPPSSCINSAPASIAAVFVYGNQGELLGEYRATDGSTLREYIWLGKIPIAVVAPEAVGAGAPSEVFFIHADHLNTPRIIVDMLGRQRWHWLSAEPFGDSLPNEDPSGLGKFSFDLRFPGQLFDRDTGLTYNHHRDYDASLGRYTQSDPIGLEGGDQHLCLCGRVAHDENRSAGTGDVHVHEATAWPW